MVTASPAAEATEKFLRLAHGDVIELVRAGCEMPNVRRIVLVLGRNGLECGDML
jgi:predicted patatin/cPLA2 family phospholipase